MTATIIGARRAGQLEDRLEPTKIARSAEELTQLDNVTKPALAFPQRMQPLSAMTRNGQTAVNGIAGGPSVIIKPGKGPH